MVKKVTGNSGNINWYNSFVGKSGNIYQMLNKYAYLVISLRECILNQ